MKTTWLWHGRVSWKKITLSRSTQKPATHQRSMPVIYSCFASLPLCTGAGRTRAAYLSKLCKENLQQRGMAPKGYGSGNWRWQTQKGVSAFQEGQNPPTCHLIVLLIEGQKEGFGACRAGPWDQVTRAWVPVPLLQRWILGRPKDHGEQKLPCRVCTCISVRKKQEIRRWQNPLVDLLQTVVPEKFWTPFMSRMELLWTSHRTS